MHRQKDVPGDHGTGGSDSGFEPDVYRGRAGSGADGISAPSAVMAAGNRDSRSRYLLSFGLLLALFCPAVSVESEFRNGTADAGGKSQRFYLRKAETDGPSHRLEIRLPRILAPRFWRSTGGVRLPAADLFCQSHRQPLCAGISLRGQADGGPGHDRAAGTGADHKLRRHGAGGVCRLHDFHGVCAADFRPGAADVHAGGLRRDDRLYLLGDNGFSGDVRGGLDIVSLHNWSLAAFPAPPGGR